MTFAAQLRPLVGRVGTTEAARLCGVTPRSLQLWMRGDGIPNAATQRGCLVILRETLARTDNPLARHHR